LCFFFYCFFGVIIIIGNYYNNCQLLTKQNAPSREDDNDEDDTLIFAGWIREMVEEFDDLDEFYNEIQQIITPNQRFCRFWRR